MRCLQRRPPLNPTKRYLRHCNGDPALHVPLRLRLPSFCDDSESRVKTSFSRGPILFLHPSITARPYRLTFLPDSFIVMHFPSSIGRFSLSRCAKTTRIQFLVAVVVLKTHISISRTPISLSLVNHIHYTLSTTIVYHTLTLE